MKTTYIIYVTVFLALLCSCSGISERKALKIAEETSGFNESLYRLLIIGEHWCLSDSSYVNEGNGHIGRLDDTDVHMPDFKNSVATEWTDIENNQIILDLSSFGMQYRNTPFRCDGCIQCYQKFTEKELITLNIIDANDGGQTQRVNVKLTEKGKEFMLDMQDENKKNELLGDSRIGAKIAQKVYFSVKEMNKTENKAKYLFEYYIEYTPWAEALGYITDKNKIYRERVIFEKKEQDWLVVSKEGIERNGNIRNF